MPEARIDGRLVDELERKPGEASRDTWNGVATALSTTRCNALDAVEDAEAAVRAALDGYLTTETELTAAQRSRDRAQTILQQRRTSLMQARRSLAWRLGIAELDDDDH